MFDDGAFLQTETVLGVPGRAGATHVVPFRMIAGEQVFQARKQIGELANQHCVAASRQGKRFPELCHDSLVGLRPGRYVTRSSTGSAEKKACGGAGVKPAS